MTEKQIKKELRKCARSMTYFATKYIEFKTKTGEIKKFSKDQINEMERLEKAIRGGDELILLKGRSGRMYIGVSKIYKKGRP